MARNSTAYAPACYEPSGLRSTPELGTQRVSDLGTRGEKLFKARLRLALERKGLKKIALAKHCRVVPSAVTGWLDDDGPSPEMSRLELIADFIGEEIAWFFTPLDDEVASLPDLIERAERLTRGIKELAAEGARKPPPKKS